MLDSNKNSTLPKQNKKKLFNIPLIYETTVINFQIQFQTVFRGQLENLTIVIKW